jgi:hypothetical protein
MTYHGYTYKFIWNIIFFRVAEELGDGGIFKLLGWITWHQSTWDHEILYVVRSSKMKYLTTFAKNQKSQRGVWLKFNIYVSFYG